MYLNIQHLKMNTYIQTYKLNIFIANFNQPVNQHYNVHIMIQKVIQCKMQNVYSHEQA